MEKFIWITGASSGIGKELALQLLQNGKNVFAIARRQEKLDELVTSAGTTTGKLVTAVCDVSDFSSVDKVLSEFLANSLRAISVLVNNAGVTSFKNVTDESWEMIQKIMQTNLLGAIYCTNKVLPEMINSGEGAIINILSVVCKKVLTKSSAYSASKAGLEAYANVLREEVRKKNVHILNVYPGATITGIWPEHVVNAYGEKMMQSAHVAEAILDLLLHRKTAYAEELVLRPVTGDL